ncbi:MAG: response regulator transcription factor [Lachnospiraceae bacterium]|jgi:DNA-binding response OmpR family regulator|nr:response regulator transcription factor [Lachnospiraceae bacterium]MCR4927985.1 response regulator transcription factor [Lachnospiraceae bacterium]
MSRILVVDDEKNIVKGLKLYLENDGDNVDAAYDGEEAMALVKEAMKLPKDERYDAILLDVMLPKLDGFEVLQQIREIDDVPVIMLTAKGEDMDKILGLEYGADDYITKPFNVLEVKARLKAIMRRSKPKKENGAEGGKVIKIGDLVLESDAKRVISSGREINLTAKEYDLLDLLANNPDKVYSREDLLRIVWGYDFPGDVRTVDVHIRRLREKIEDNPGEPRYVQTKWGRGYYLKP